MAERENNVRETWITGIGIVSCLGEGPDAHWQALGSGHPQADATTSGMIVRQSGLILTA